MSPKSLSTDLSDDCESCLGLRFFTEVPTGSSAAGALHERAPAGAKSMTEHLVRSDDGRFHGAWSFGLTCSDTAVRASAEKWHLLSLPTP
jgi:hypothetical protein